MLVQFLQPYQRQGPLPIINVTYNISIATSAVLRIRIVSATLLKVSFFVHKFILYSFILYRCFLKIVFLVKSE